MNNEAEQLTEKAWQELLEKDDRSSPTEYPEMALISFEELRGYILDAASFRARLLKERDDG